MRRVYAINDQANLGMGNDCNLWLKQIEFDNRQLNTYISEIILSI